MKTRSALIVAVLGAASLGLTACGAGQISQTADQVAAVDGASGQTEDAAVYVRDVTVLVNDSNQASLKFTAMNDEKKAGEAVVLQGVKVENTPVNVAANPHIGSGCSLVINTPRQNEVQPSASHDAMCAEYGIATVADPGAVPGQQRTVTFSFSNGDITVNAPVSKEL